MNLSSEAMLGFLQGVAKARIVTLTKCFDVTPPVLGCDQ